MKTDEQLAEEAFPIVKGNTLVEEIQLAKRAAFILGRRSRDAEVEELKAKVNNHARYYSLEIFPNSENLTDKSSRDSISAYMGRHMCKVFLEYIDECFKPFAEKP